MARNLPWIIGCGALCVALSMWPCQALEIFDSVISSRRLKLIKMKAEQWDPILHRLNASAGKKEDANAQCRADMRRFIDAIVHRQLAGLQLLDSQGSMPTGILHGALSDMGSHRECFAAEILDEKGNVIARKFCALYVYNSEPVPNFPDIIAKERSNAKTFAFLQSAVKVGACIPSSCSEDDIKIILNEALSEWELSTFVSACDHNVPPDEPSVFVILTLAAFVTAVVLATALDVLHRQKLALADQAAADADFGSFLARLQTLSLLRTTRETFCVDASGSGKGAKLDVFNGLRVVGLVWVIAIHSYIFMDDALIDNSDEMYEMSRTLGRQFIVNATMSVAIFTTVSGFMLWMTVSKRSPEENGKTSWLSMVLHRYLRLFPLVIVTSCFHHLMPVSGYGPLWATFGELRKRAFPENWPFYVAGMLNYLDLDKICSPQHWYTGMDFQVFTITLYFAYRLKRSGSKRSLLIIMGLSTLITYVQNHMLELTPGLLYYTPLGRHKYAGSVYYMPYTHIPSYCIGVLAGYYYTKQPSRRLSRRKVAILWVAALAAITMSLCGTILWTGVEQPSQAVTAVYAATTRIFYCGGLAWLMYACLTDRGGFLTDALAWPGWAPISRLSYSIYIIHDFMLYYQWVAFPSRVNGGYYFMMTVVAGNCVGSFAMAFVLHAFFERPINLMATLLEERCLPGRRTVARDALAASEQENGVVIPKRTTTVRGRNDRTKRL
ncbi:nose resistant to fluoxetine protein 6 [Rhipicephalus microplus]|uniref:nose resistant to fluoxetine protein 6 n=1 Tax=Rhipicephalus microplus TaxID=6941 RepID=UPI003F6D7B4E